MDSLRTQKVRKLTKLYRQMKIKLKQDQRMQLISNVLELIRQEDTTKPLVEVYAARYENKSCNFSFLFYLNPVAGTSMS